MSIDLFAAAAGEPQSILEEDRILLVEAIRGKAAAAFVAEMGEAGNGGVILAAIEVVGAEEVILQSR